MADQEKHGTDWTEGELDLIVADYFAMLGDELAGKPYVKSHHAQALMALTGRTHRSVETKHMNISAVLRELGLPTIRGYKPATNYQRAIFGAIDRYLAGHPLVMLAKPVLKVGVAESQQLFLEPPPLLGAPKGSRPPDLERLVRKYDPSERDHRNKLLGDAGEELVFNFERKRLSDEGRDDLAGKVRWTSREDGDGAGYDIRSFGSNGADRLIEVKTTIGAQRTPFFITRNEYEVSEERCDAYHLMRLYDFAREPKAFELKPPLSDVLQLDTHVYRASFGGAA